MNGHHHNHNLSHQRQQQGCGRSHDPATRAGAGEWEQHQNQNPVNGRAKRAAERTVPTLTRNVHDARRNDRKTTRSSEAGNTMEEKQKCYSKNVEEKTRSHIPCAKGNVGKMKSGCLPQNSQRVVQRGVTQRPPPVVKSFVGYQSGSACYVGAAGVVGQENGVFGVYSETKYTFAVNGLPGNPAQASAAAAFFAR